MPFDFLLIANTLPPPSVSFFIIPEFYSVLWLLVLHMEIAVKTLTIDHNMLGDMPAK